MNEAIDKKIGNNISSLSKIKEINIADNIDDLLTTYAFFLASSPDTLYNISYYTDRIKLFKESIAEFQQRYKLYQSILPILHKLFIKKINLETGSFIVEFDEIFQYEFEEDDDDLNLNFIKEKVNRFRIDSITILPYSFHCTIFSEQMIITDCLYLLGKTDNQKNIKAEIKSNFEKTIRIANQVI